MGGGRGVLENRYYLRNFKKGNGRIISLKKMHPWEQTSHVYPNSTNYSTSKPYPRQGEKGPSKQKKNPKKNHPKKNFPHLKTWKCFLGLKFGEDDGPNLCRVKKVDVSSTLIENIFRPGLTLLRFFLSGRLRRKGFLRFFSRIFLFLSLFFLKWGLLSMILTIREFTLLKLLQKTTKLKKTGLGFEKKRVFPTLRKGKGREGGGRVRV